MYGATAASIFQPSTTATADVVLLGAGTVAGGTITGQTFTVAGLSPATPGYGTYEGTREPYTDKPTVTIVNPIDGGSVTMSGKFDGSGNCKVANTCGFKLVAHLFSPDGVFDQPGNTLRDPGAAVDFVLTPVKSDGTLDTLNARTIVATRKDAVNGRAGLNSKPVHGQAAADMVRPAGPPRATFGRKLA